MEAPPRAAKKEIFLRMPLISRDAYGGRLSPFDLILVRDDFTRHKLSLPEPLGRQYIYNGAYGVVVVNVTFYGRVPCAVRMQGLNGGIAKHDPLTPIDDRDEWAYFIRGMKRGADFHFGPMIYTIFQTTAGLVPEGDNRNTAAASVKSIALGVNAVELMKETLYGYGVLQRGELTADDFYQFVELFNRMKKAYASIYPKFPYDLHSRNCMYKLENGKRVWLWTDIDESPSYMEDNKKTALKMAVKVFEDIARQDAIPPSVKAQLKKDKERKKQAKK
jgi:hypothetical protein